MKLAGYPVHDLYYCPRLRIWLILLFKLFCRGICLSEDMSVRHFASKGVSESSVKGFFTFSVMNEFVVINSWLPRMLSLFIPSLVHRWLRTMYMLFGWWASESL